MSFEPWLPEGRLLATGTRASPLAGTLLPTTWLRGVAGCGAGRCNQVRPDTTHVSEQSQGD